MRERARLTFWVAAADGRLHSVVFFRGGNSSVLVFFGPDLRSTSFFLPTCFFVCSGDVDTMVDNDLCGNDLSLALEPNKEC